MFEAHLANEEVVNIERQHGDSEVESEALVVEVTIEVNESPEDREISVSSHVVPEASSLGYAITTGSSKF